MVVGARADVVDFTLVNLCQTGDVVVTRDYGVAVTALSCKAYAVRQDGWEYTDEILTDCLPSDIPLHRLVVHLII